MFRQDDENKRGDARQHLHDENRRRDCQPAYKARHRGSDEEEHLHLPAAPPARHVGVGLRALHCAPHKPDGQEQIIHALIGWYMAHEGV